MNVREATDEDVMAIAQIHVAGWRTSYRGILPASLLEGLTVEERMTLWSDGIRGIGVSTFVATNGARVVGFARICPPRAIAAPPADAAEISHLYVDPALQGHGAGRMLLEHSLQEAQDRGYQSAILWVLAENHRARKFYESFGFVPDGAQRTDPEFLGGDAVEVRYWAPLEPGVA